MSFHVHEVHEPFTMMPTDGLMRHSIPKSGVSVAQRSRFARRERVYLSASSAFPAVCLSRSRPSYTEADTALPSAPEAFQSRP